MWRCNFQEELPRGVFDAENPRERVTGCVEANFDTKSSFEKVRMTSIALTPSANATTSRDRLRWQCQTPRQPEPRKYVSGSANE
jgi:hypothetical protein